MCQMKNMCLLCLTMVLLFKEIYGCDYDGCTQVKEGVLNVHIVPHSHDAFGWVNSFDEYYGDQVKQILLSVVKELWKNSKRRFMFVETGYFFRWWSTQSELVKNQMHVLVKEGRFKFIGGAWTMNDAATTHYQSIIDQFTWGLKKLSETFGSCATPRVAWQIDPFGHSREFASLLAAMGYDGVFLCKIASQELEERKDNLTTELIWRGSGGLENSSDIFVGIFYNHYSTPEGFNFVNQSDCTTQDVDIKINEFYGYLKELTKTYTTDNILIAMENNVGGTRTKTWFENLDMLIKLINKKATKEKRKIYMFYSTPDCYLNAVKNANTSLTVKNDDFLPYAYESGDGTGNFASRPTLKYFERDANRYLQMMNQLYVMAGLSNHRDRAVIDELRSAFGIMQIHSTMTDAEKQYAAENYKKTLSRSVDRAILIANKAFTTFSGGKSSKIVFNFNKCQLNQSECNTSETSDSFITTIYNPLAWELLDVNVVIPVPKEKYIVYDSQGDLVDAQLSPILEWYQYNIPARRSNATHELTFIVKSVAPLGFESFYFQKLKKGIRDTVPNGDDIKPIKVYENDLLDLATSILENIESGDYGSTRPGNFTYNSNRSEHFLWYNSTLKNMFMTSDNIRNNVTAVLKRIIKNKGNIILQIQWLCNPLFLVDNKRKQVFVRYNTNILSKGIFYTDSNGRQMIKRTLLSQINLPETDYFANYYSVPSRISISDNETKFTIFTDHSEFGYSPKDGAIELMINRKLIMNHYQMGMGLNEALDEEGLVTLVNHNVMISNIKGKKSNLDEKTFSFEVNMPPIILFSDVKQMSLSKWMNMKLSKGGLKRSFPEGINLLTLEPWQKMQLLLRLENYFEPSYSNDTDIEIDLCHIFTSFTITSMRETTLAANQWLDQRQNTIETDALIENNDKCQHIKLHAKQIRTFIVNYEITSI